MNGRIGNYVFSMGGRLSRTIISLQIHRWVGSDVEIIKKCAEISMIVHICAPLFVVSFQTHPRNHAQQEKDRHNGSLKETLFGARPAIACRKGKEKTPKRQPNLIQGTAQSYSHIQHAHPIVIVIKHTHTRSDHSPLLSARSCF